jgi:hypothetical protein
MNVRKDHPESSRNVLSFEDAEKINIYGNDFVQNGFFFEMARCSSGSTVVRPGKSCDGFAQIASFEL